MVKVRNMVKEVKTAYTPVLEFGQNLVKVALTILVSESTIATVT